MVHKTRVRKKSADEPATNNPDLNRTSLSDNQLAEQLVKMISEDKQFINKVGQSGTLIHAIAANDRIASRVALRLRSSVLKDAFIHDLGDKVMSAKRSQIGETAASKARQTFADEKILERIGRLEQEVRSFRECWKELVMAYQ